MSNSKKYKKPTKSISVSFSGVQGENGTSYEIAKSYFKEDNPELPTDDYRFVAYCFDLHDNQFLT